jgi:hypothetical protein
VHGQLWNQHFVPRGMNQTSGEHSLVTEITVREIKKIRAVLPLLITKYILWLSGGCFCKVYTCT